MAIFVGNYGNITLGGTDYCEVTEWTVDIIFDRVDTTAIDNVWKTYALGLRSATGTFTSLERVPEFSTPATVVGADFKTEKSSGETISGDIFITKESVRVNVNDIVTWTYEFVFDDVVTVT